MNAASVKHARIHGNAYSFFREIKPEIEWLIDLDFKKLTDDGIVYVRPDITGIDRRTGEALYVVEISKASITYDLGEKSDTYAAFGIPYYIVFDCRKDRVFQFELVEGKYKPTIIFVSPQGVFNE